MSTNQKDGPTNLLPAADAANGNPLLIGASAGSVRELKKFFARIPDDSEHLYIVLQLSSEMEGKPARAMRLGGAAPVDQELGVEEPAGSSEVLQSLINSIDIGVVYLDRRLRIKFFTQPAAGILNLVPDDVGHPLMDLSSRLEYENLVQDARQVLADLVPIEHEVRVRDGGWHMMRMLPYRTAEDRIDGVVLTFVDISSRRKTEEELVRSQQQLRQAMNIETVGVVFFDNDIRFVDCNDTFLRMTGFDRADIESGKFSLEKLTPPEWKDVSRQAIAELTKTGYATPYEKEYLRKDGTRFFGLFAAARVNENEIVEYLIDITSAKQTERDLRFQSTLLDTVDQSIIATDLEGKIIYWNRYAEKLFGWKAGEVIGRNVAGVTVPEPDAEKGAEIMSRIRSGKSWNGEFRVKRRDGSTFVAHVYNSPISNEKGEVIGIVGVSIDVTRRRKTEDALRESEERLRMLIESATDYAIFTITEDNIVDSWSPGATRVFGYRDKEIIGRTGELLFTADDRANGEPEKEMRTARATGKAEDERWHLRKDGSHFYASGVMQPLTDGRQGFVKICRDQTARIKTDTALREKEMLQQLVTTQEDERRRIARDIHDHLGQQLTALRLKLSSLLEACDEDELCDQIEEIQKAAEQLDRDVDFLAWEIRPASLDDLGLRVTLGNFVREWERYTGVKAEFHATGLSRSRLPFEMETNLYRIGQEALNNVQKHAKANHVSVLLEKRGTGVVLIVEDDGVGFDPVAAGRRNKGLGLSGMKERAAIIGGTLEVESAKGKGTTVFAKVPVKIGKNKE
jgi:PAS domain S-box-containing protein